MTVNEALKLPTMNTLKNPVLKQSVTNNVKAAMLCSEVVRAPYLRTTGHGFDSRPQRCRDATLDKLFTHVSRASEATTARRYRNVINLKKKNHLINNSMCRRTYSAGNVHDRGKMLYSFAYIFSIRLRFLARRSFLQISLMPGK